MSRPRVFVSSASRGMGDLRQGLAYVLDQRGFEVLAFEEATFPIAGDREALDECLQIVGSADYYLLLIGDSGGRVEAGTSPTREEFRAAKASFLATGRPRLVLAVRAATRAAVESWRVGAAAGSLDNPDFISEFVAEVEAAGQSAEPNWLHRFNDFRELMDILVTRLQLGRSHEETLARRAVLDELLSNLAHMTSRSGESAFPHHLWVRRAREQISLRTEDLGSELTVSREVAGSLGGSFTVGRLASLSTAAMERAVLSGVFLDYSPTEQKHIPSPLHGALIALIADVKAAKAVLEGSPDWRVNLMSAAAIANRQKTPVLVLAEDVLPALLYFDRAENVFQGQLALVRFLLGKSASPLPDPSKRRPLSPIESAADGIWRESVEPFEIQQLIEAELAPFGLRLPSTVMGSLDVGEMATELATLTRPELEQMLSHLDPGTVSKLGDLDELLLNSARDLITSLTASSGEGIEDRSPAAAQVPKGSNES